MQPAVTDWSVVSLAEYMQAHDGGLSVALEALEDKLRAIAREATEEAERRALNVYTALQRLVPPAQRLPWDFGILESRACTLMRDLAALRRERHGAPVGAPDRFRLERELCALDEASGRCAMNSSEATAFGLFLRHGLITREQYEEVEEAASPQMWLYAGH